MKLTEIQILSLLTGVVLGISFITSTIGAVTWEGFPGEDLVSYYIGWRIQTADIFAFLLVIYLFFNKHTKSYPSTIWLIIFGTLILSAILGIHQNNSILHITRFGMYIALGTYIAQLKGGMIWLMFGVVLTVIFNIIWAIPGEFFEGTDNGLKAWDGAYGNSAVYGGLVVFAGFLILETRKYKLDKLEIATIAFFATAVLPSASRTALVASIFLIIITSFYVFKYSKPSAKYSLLILILFGFTFLQIANEGKYFTNKVNSTYYFINNPTINALPQITSHRSLDYKEAITQTIKDYPLFGVGFYNHRATIERVPHSVPIILYMELGILSLIIIGSILYLLWKTKFLPIVAILLISLTDFYFYAGTWGGLLTTGVIIGISIQLLTNRKFLNIPKS